MRGVVLRAEETSDDIYAAVDAVLDKMQRQIKRYKGKRWLNRSNGNGAEAQAVAVAEAEELAEADEALEPAGVIARRKRFTVAPMNKEEALEQMLLLGHNNFFVFYNANSAHQRALRRNDGSFPDRHRKSANAQSAALANWRTNVGNASAARSRHLSYD